MKYKEIFPIFIKRLDERMEKGFKEYGDGSFDRDPQDVLNEIQQELLDVCGWSVILFHILETKKKQVVEENENKNIQ